MANIKGGHRGGRPTKLTEETQKQIIGLLQEGNYIETACRACGITKESFYTWLEKGQGVETVTPDGTVVIYDNPTYRIFREKALQAIALSEVALVHNARKGLDGWQASMTILERRFPQRWARRERTEVTGPGGGPVRVEIDVRAKIMAILNNGAARLREGQTPAVIDVGKESKIGQQEVAGVLPNGDAGSRPGESGQLPITGGTPALPVDVGLLGSVGTNPPAG